MVVYDLCVYRVFTPTLELRMVIDSQKPTSMSSSDARRAKRGGSAGILSFLWVYLDELLVYIYVWSYTTPHFLICLFVLLNYIW